MQDKVHTLVAGHTRGFGQHLVSVHSAAGDQPGFWQLVHAIGNHGVWLPELLLIFDTSLGKTQRGCNGPLRHGGSTDAILVTPAACRPAPASRFQAELSDPIRPYKNPVENQGTAATRINPSTSAPRYGQIRRIAASGLTRPMAHAA